jgi:iron complex outermembrane receptor protein
MPAAAWWADVVKALGSQTPAPSAAVSCVEYQAYESAGDKSNQFSNNKRLKNPVHLISEQYTMKKNVNHQDLLRLSAVSLAVLLAFPAHGQAAEDQEPEQKIKSDASVAILETVVITAEKRKSTPQKTPLAITALPASVLDQRGITDAKNLSGIVPSVHIGEQGRDTSISIRGVSSTNVAPSQDPSVAFNVDGVYFPRPTGQNGAFYDVERVEVLRGPQGTLWGRNSTAGAINIITNKPVLGDFGGNADLTLGNYSRRTLQATVNIPVSDTFAMRASVLKNERDGFTGNIGGGPVLDDASEIAGRWHALWRPNSDLQVLLSLDKYDRDGAGSSSRRTSLYSPATKSYVNLLATGAASKDVANSDFNQTFINRNAGAGLEVTYSFDSFDVISLTSYREAMMDLWSDADGTPAAGSNFRLYEPNRSISEELRFSSNGNQKIQWVGGLYYSEEVNRDDVFINVGPVTTPTNGFAFIKPNMRAKSKAVFGQTTFPASDTVNITAGARYTSDERSSTNQTDQAILFGAPAVARPDNFFSANKVTWRVGADWSPTKSNMLYANLSTGYKSGGYSTLAAYKPETIRSFEVGSKNRFYANRVEVNVSAFDYDYKDLQLTSLVSIPGGAAIGVTVNAASAKVRGLEVEFNARPTPEFKVFGNASFLKASFESYPNALERMTGTLANVTGNTLPRAPDFSANVGASYDYKIGNGLLTSRFETRYSTKYFLTEFNDARNAGGVSGLNAYAELATQPSFTRSRASLRYTPNHAGWYGEVFVDNIENERTLDGIIVSESTNGPGGTIASYGTPKTFGIKVGMNF